jgi:hypothetical protein
MAKSLKIYLCLLPFTLLWPVGPHLFLTAWTVIIYKHFFPVILSSVQCLYSQNFETLHKWKCHSPSYSIKCPTRTKYLCFAHHHISIPVRADKRNASRFLQRRQDDKFVTDVLNVDLFPAESLKHFKHCNWLQFITDVIYKCEDIIS